MMVFFVAVQEVGLLLDMLHFLYSSSSGIFGMVLELNVHGARTLFRDVFAGIDPDLDAKVEFGAFQNLEIQLQENK
ncbi:hypothetical protein LWI28_002255 [Acer negundo]|uniref:Uncharacterized protein n=1 Tax=Acer negundo TaxID=4023 RepID=A0AAD5NIC7_ACENE|nr:hypothetical protein LWI28_002255 [Acer negundo]